MTEIRNTTADMADPDGVDRLLLLAIGLSTGSPSSFIEGQERAGQSQLVRSQMLPTDTGRAADDSAYEALGFTFGEADSSDPLFRPATLPAGWSKRGSDHDMWSYVIDELGRDRVAVFYKAEGRAGRVRRARRSVRCDGRECDAPVTDLTSQPAAPVLDRCPGCGVPARSTGCERARRNRPSRVGEAGGSVGRLAVLRLLRRQDRLRCRADLSTQFGPLVELEQCCRVFDGHDDGNRAVVPLDDGSLSLDQGCVDVVAQSIAGCLDSDSHSLYSLAHVVSVQTDQTFRKACGANCKFCKVCQASPSTEPRRTVTAGPED